MRRNVRRAAAVLCGALVAICLTATPAAAGYEFRLTPKVGGTKTRFFAHFRAPWAEDGDKAYYYVLARGPRPCAVVYAFGLPTYNLSPGEKGFVGIEPKWIEPWVDWTAGGLFRRWCRGRYTGYLEYVDFGRRRRHTLGRVVFRVR